MNKIFSFKRPFLAYDLVFEEEDFQIVLYTAIREEVTIVLNYFAGIMNINLGINDISRIDYEFISTKMNEINTFYLKLYKIEKEIDLMLLTTKMINTSIEEMAQILKESKDKLDEILINRISNLEKELQMLEKNKHKN
ncbi:MAG: hypothetical protein ACMXYB_04600 [Candidatus Woesearchaeota archaeon]